MTHSRGADQAGSTVSERHDVRILGGKRPAGSAPTKQTFPFTTTISPTFFGRFCWALRFQAVVSHFFLFRFFPAGC